MSLSRRDFIQLMGAAAASGMFMNVRSAFAAPTFDKLYDIPRFGNVHLLHFTDCHAQLKPIYFREPNLNLGIGVAKGRVPHLVGQNLLQHLGIPSGSPEAYAFSCLDFEKAA
jgi:sulfur-oxidizing protein SoxB